MPNELAHITSAELKALPAARTVFFFAVGPLEDHGPHLPLGLDAAEAHALCRLAALRLEAEMPGWSAVLMPAAPLGIDADTSVIALRSRPHVLRDWLVDTCDVLGRAGFTHFVCFTGHRGPRQLTAIEEAGRLLQKRWMWRRRRPVLISACSARVSAREVFEAPLRSDPREHGGLRDTSVALALAAQGGAPVSPDYAHLPTRMRPGSPWARLLRHARGQVSGYWGSPADASAELGVRYLAAEIDAVFPKLRQVWEGKASANRLFRSWYSILPPNRSFFRAWVLSLGVLFFMGIWLALTYRGIGWR